jgi:hypothetical protein
MQEQWKDEERGKIEKSLPYTSKISWFFLTNNTWRVYLFKKIMIVHYLKKKDHDILDVYDKLFFVLSFFLCIWYLPLKCLIQEGEKFSDKNKSRGGSRFQTWGFTRTWSKKARKKWHYNKVRPDVHLVHMRVY